MVWKCVKTMWPKYHVVNNITCVVLLVDFAVWLVMLFFWRAST